MRTRDAVQSFGAKTKRLGGGHWQITGRGAKGWKSPTLPIDFGNAGTGVRLVMGAASGYNLRADYIGDQQPILTPYGTCTNPSYPKWGPNLNQRTANYPLSQTKGGNLAAISFTPPHASAQVKSAILLAGLNTKGVTEIIETRPTRDHTRKYVGSIWSQNHPQKR